MHLLEYLVFTIDLKKSMEFNSSFLVKAKELLFRITKLGFNGIDDGSGYHIGYKMLDTFENLTMADDEEKTLLGDYPINLFAGKQLIFFKLI